MAGVNQRRRNKVYSRIRAEFGIVRCYCCGEPVARGVATVEHIIPLLRGGTNDPGNLDISHQECNQQRGSPKANDRKFHRNHAVKSRVVVHVLLAEDQSPDDGRQMLVRDWDNSDDRDVSRMIRG